MCLSEESQRDNTKREECSRKLRLESTRYQLPSHLEGRSLLASTPPEPGALALAPQQGALVILVLPVVEHPRGVPADNVRMGTWWEKEIQRLCESVCVCMCVCKCVCDKEIVSERLCARETVCV